MLNAAIEVFTELGYHKCNISDIVSQAQVGQGTFYRNFKSKREIFEVLLQKTIEELISEFSEGMLNMNNMPSSFKEYREMSISAFLKAAPIIERNKKVVILFFRDAATIDREFEQEVDDIFERFAELAKHYLDHAIEQGFARPCNTHVVSLSIVGMGTQLLKDWIYGKYDDLNIEDIIVEVNDLVFLGTIQN